MRNSVPELEVYYIDFAPVEEEKHDEESSELIKVGLALVSTVLPAPASLAMGAFVSRDIHKQLKRFFDKNLFHVIRTPEELQQFENAHGNDWVINEKKAKKRQYYIRHPKKAKRNILIEAKSFHEYIENEYREEIIHYILSHCKAKRILIDREEMSSVSVKGKGKVKGLDLDADLDVHNTIGEYYKCESTKGLGREKKRNEYYWLDKYFMLSVNALKTSGSTLETKFTTDFSFGLKGGEAKTLGLEVGRQKKYTYYVRVEC